MLTETSLECERCTLTDDEVKQVKVRRIISSVTHVHNLCKACKEVIKDQGYIVFIEGGK